MYLSVKELAKKINLHPNTIRKAIHNGKITAVRLGEGKNSAFRIPETEIERLILIDLKEIFEIKN